MGFPITDFLVLASFFGAFWLEMRVAKKVAKGEVSQEALTTTERLLVILLCVFNPIFNWIVLYYGWHKKLPIKAKQVNVIAIVIFVLELVVFMTTGIGIIF